MTGISDPIRIGNGSGFYGDRFAAMREMLEGGPLDVLTGDYLAELTLLILGRDRIKDPAAGYAKTFLRQMETCLGLALDRGVKIVVNAGGLNPAGLVAALGALAARLGLHPRLASVEGDDLLARAGELGLGTPLTANAYLGGWGIAACLEAGADVVVTGRVTDASLVVGPAAARFGWARDDWDRLAAATVAGHLIECGPQVTGGNFAFFEEIDARRPGFPIAEIHADGTVVVTKHPGHGGAVTVETVTAQLLYEIGGARYGGPDVTTRLDSVRLSADGPDRVRVSGVAGEPPPPSLKVCLNHLGGYRNEVVFLLTGLAIEAKAALVRAQVEAALERPPAELVWSTRSSARPDAATEAEASALLCLTAKDEDPRAVGRAFSNVAVELALASYPGFALTAPPGEAQPFGVYTAAHVAQGEVAHVACLPDGTRLAVAPAAVAQPLAEPPPAPLPAALPGGPARRAPIGLVAGARSGDKGGLANLGVWGRTEEAYRWLAHWLDAERLAAILPETASFPIARHLFPEIRALNFVIDGLLGEGVASSTRFDPQAKALGEWLRAREVEIPEVVLASVASRA